jgi:homoserine O-succinyltransferase
MAVILPGSYPIQGRSVPLITAEEASRSDIRPLRIGIINIMPQAERYEYHLLYPLGKSVLQVSPVWIRLKNHAYKSSDPEHLKNYYVSFEQAIEQGPLDGLIITGAPVEELPFEAVTYWEELEEILGYARTGISSTMGICWGGLALAKTMGIEKMLYPQKVFGVYETRNLKRNHPITGDFDDVFYCPQSRHAGIHDILLEEAAKDKEIDLLAHADGAGYVIFGSSDGRFIMHVGHPEYEAERIAVEYFRDRKKGRSDVPEPRNFDVDNPRNRWRMHCLDFFAQWIRFLYESGPGKKR